MDNALANVLLDQISYFCAKEISEDCKKSVIEYLEKGANIYKNSKLNKRQFNEILLICNETRVTEEFFEYFVNGDKELEISKFPTLIDRFKTHSMLKYGNFRFAFKELTRSKAVKELLSYWLRDPTTIIVEFKNRPDPILNIEKIPKDLVHKLGYLTDEENDQETRDIGEYNTGVYLTSDYMDVYVATSMRDEIDFQNVYDLCEGVFSETKIKDLKLRYFDPTQSFHKNRVAKGLIEGLMLKRAKCTIYAAQESDSFGKDSELASTLAQGKPVIAFIPRIDPNDKGYRSKLRNMPILKLYDKAEICEGTVKGEDWDDFVDILNEIDGFIENELKDSEMREKLSEKLDRLIEIISYAESDFYENRAATLRWYHPLGFQVHLETGVANGVLVARTYKECADILFDVLTNNLQFDIIKPGERVPINGEPRSDELNFLLFEKKSKCAFRVVTTDDLLTNSFWNFYLEGGT